MDVIMYIKVYNVRTWVLNNITTRGHQSLE